MSDNVIELQTEEQGQASILITINGPIVRVIHGSCGDILLEREVKRGWWDELWAFLEGKANE